MGEGSQAQDGEAVDGEEQGPPGKVTSHPLSIFANIAAKVWAVGPVGRARGGGLNTQPCLHLRGQDPESGGQSLTF